VVTKTTGLSAAVAGSNLNAGKKLLKQLRQMPGINSLFRYL